MLSRRFCKWSFVALLALAAPMTLSSAAGASLGSPSWTILPPFCGTPEPDAAGSLPSTGAGNFAHIPAYAIKCTLDSIAAQSNGRMTVQQIGASALGRPLYSVTINALGTAAQQRDFANWQALRGYVLQNPAKAQTVLEGFGDNVKVPLVIQSGIHGDEPESVDASMQLISDLATTPYGTDPAVDAILDHSVVVFEVDQNPDGRALGTHGNGAGFDLDRDYLTQSQPETKASVALLQSWLAPDVLNGQSGLASTVITGATRPHNPAVDYDLYLKWNEGRLQANEAALSAAGFPANPNALQSWCPYDSGPGTPLCPGGITPGPTVSEGFDDFGPFAAATYSQQIGLDSSTVAACNSPAAACGGAAGARLVQYTTDTSTLAFDIAHRQSLLNDEFEHYRRAAAGEARPPCCDAPFGSANDFMTPFAKAYVIPWGAGQRSNAEANRLVSWLLRNGVAVTTLDADATFGGRTFPKGSYVVWTKQALGGLVDTTLGVGSDVSSLVGGIANTPAAWSHGSLWGADTVTIPAGASFGPGTTPASKVNFLGGGGVENGHAPGEPGSAEGYALRLDSPTAVRALNALLQAGTPAQLALHSFATVSAGTYPAGSAVFPDTARAALAASGQANGLIFKRYSLSALSLQQPITHVPHIVVIGDTDRLQKAAQWVQNNLGFDADAVSTSALNSSPTDPLSGVDLVFNQGAYPPPMNTMARARLAAFFARAGGYVGAGAGGASFLTDAGQVSGLTAASDSGLGQSGIVGWTNAGGADSPITGAYPAADTALADPPDWLTSLPATMSADATFPATGLLAAGFWPNAAASAPGSALIAHGTNAGGTARLTEFALDPTDRGDPEREWPALADAIYWSMQPVPAGAPDPVLNLETLTVAQADQAMQNGTLTSVQLTNAYLARIAALNTHGPGLNAVRSLNPDALAEAAAADAERAAGQNLGPMMGIPVLLKDNVDVVGMPTTAGSIPLEHSMPPVDSTVAANLKAAGAVILGKTNLSEFANFITNSNPSGYSGVGGQVLAAVDADLNPSGSSSGSGAAAAAGLAMVTIGTETSGSIISPSLTEGVVGLRPTVGLVSRFGIVPISASQDTAGPITRNVADAAAELQAIAGPDLKDHSPTLWGPGVSDSLIVPPQPLPVPNYLAALDPNALNGKRIGIISSSDANYQAAITTIRNLGATTVTIPTPSSSAGGNATTLLEYEFKRDLDNYLAHLGAGAPQHSLADVIAANNADPLEAIKFGQTLLTASQAFNVDDPNSTDSVTYRANLVAGKNGNRSALDNALTSNNIEAIMAPAATLIGIGARAGYPEITVPAGYSTTNRRPVNIAFSGTAYSEAKLIGFAYAYEQASHLRVPASMTDPSLYRCAATNPPSPYSVRGGCPPGHELLSTIGTPPSLGFPLETTSAQDLEAKMAAGTLTAVDLTKAYLARIAATNVDGPAINAVRSINPNALADAAASDARRAGGHSRGPLEGLPVLVSDDVDVGGLPTTDGSVALQNSIPAGDSKLVANLKAAGAIVLGKTNTTELSGWMSTNMPAGYSSLGGQVLDPIDADLNPSGSSSGAAAAAAAGLAALEIGTEASSVTNSLSSIISPAQANGVVGLKPTVGLVSRTGILPVSLTQETAGVLGQTVYDVAAALDGMAGQDPSDPATAGQPASLPDYLALLSPTALAGKRIAVVSNTNANYQAAITALQAAGATTVVKTIPTPSPNPADIVGREVKRDMNAYLGALPAGDPIHSLQGIIDYDTANPDEALKYGTNTLTTSNGVDLTNPTTNASYTSDRTTGLTSNRAVIDNVLNNGTPADPTDDFDAIMVQAGNGLVGNADRAGYPVLTVPAGYNLTSSQTFDPVNVSFVGTAYSEPRLLADGYAYEQATHLRQAPSTTNPSMWRCVAGSAFPPHSCAP